MNDLKILWDHSQPCKHGYFVEHDSLETGFCPGGKEITLRRPTKNEVNMPGVWVDMTGRIEVDGND